MPPSASKPAPATTVIAEVVDKYADDLVALRRDLHAHPELARTEVRTTSSGVLWRRMPDDAGAAARELFAVLRDFDARGVRLIWVETPPGTPEWEGVGDRLQRAAAA